ncbi:MAG: glycosyltransferase family 8 protein [Clostridia bacterium]|nr:glycosyltransferase family 8 protein [Clostridia bacterium]
MQNQTNVVPVFFAVDDKYVPFLTISLDSLKAHASKANKYDIYILTTCLSDESKAAAKKREDENFTVYFVDVNEKLNDVSDSLHLRDYYSMATYYRIFIAGMFPELDKAVYIDSDTILLGDIAELYDTELGDNLVGAVPDGAVAIVPEFRTYTKEVLGVVAEEYFNAGVLVMNLKKFREADFYGKFCDLLQKYKFTVAQDQDYLNVACHGSVKYLSDEWNKMPISGEGAAPKLIHYNLTMKPWRYENILFKEHFWAVAEKNEYYPQVKGFLDSFTEEMAKADAECEKKLRVLCLEEAAREDNYWKKYGKA